jgi:hypothetical protein
MEAHSAPLAGRELPITTTDPRWPAAEGWVRMQQSVNGMVVHYLYNEVRPSGIRPGPVLPRVRRSRP